MACPNDGSRGVTLKTSSTMLLRPLSIIFWTSQTIVTCCRTIVGESWLLRATPYLTQAIAARRGQCNDEASELQTKYLHSLLV